MNRKLKTLLIWGLLLAVVFFVAYRRTADNDEQRPPRVTSAQSLAMIEDGSVHGYRMNDYGLVLVTSEGDFAVTPPVDPAVSLQLTKMGAAYMPDYNPPEQSNLLLWIALAAALVLGFLYFLKKVNAGNAGTKNIFELRKSKTRPVKDDDKALFADVGGNREAIELLADIVDYLRAPKRWTDAGTRLPRGILLVGAPGTGKTLLARAAAGETKSAFLYTSAAEFVEMFVGVGAARVRDSFEKAAAQQPVIMFIDELDAVGRRRGSGVGTMHEEREQTLNQLLVLMDGLEKYPKLVVMAATNRPDILDPALLRPGRFDRVVRLEPPSLADRVEILKIHTRKKPLDVDISLDRIAERTVGFTGAGLEALTNAAALIAVRRTRDSGETNHGAVYLTASDFDRAIESIATTGRRFDRLDSVLVESASQFAEPTGRAVARFTLTTGTVIEGEVVWMNSANIKLRTTEGSDVIVSKSMVEQMVPLAGTEMTPEGDFSPDRWADRNLNVG